MLYKGYCYLCLFVLSISQVASTALRFFLGQDGMKNKVNADSDSEDDGQTARDVLLRYQVVVDCFKHDFVGCSTSNKISLKHTSVIYSMLVAVFAA